jgi:hypothetical protein
MDHITAPTAATQVASLHTLQLHGPHCHPPCSCMATSLPPSQLNTPCHHSHCSCTCYVPCSCTGHVAVPSQLHGHIAASLAAIHIAACPTAAWATSLPPLHLHTPHRHMPHIYTAILLPTSQLHGLCCSTLSSWMHHIAAPIAAIHAASPYAEQLDTPCHSPHCSYTHHVTTH